MDSGKGCGLALPVFESSANSIAPNEVRLSIVTIFNSANWPPIDTYRIDYWEPVAPPSLRRQGINDKFIGWNSNLNYLNYVKY